MVEGYEAQYGATKFVGSLIAFVGWVVLIAGAVGVFLGIIAALQLPDPGRLVMAAIAASSFLFALIGLLCAGVGQFVRATADNANYNGAILALMKAAKTA